MSRPINPHPVSPVRPRPLPGPKPAPQPQPRPRLVDDVWFRIGVAVGAVGALLLVTHYLVVSLALPRAQRHRRRPPSPASGTAASWSGVASAAVPSSFGGAV